MAINTSLNPLPPGDFGPAQALHLIRRAGFGPAPGQVRELTEMGPQRAVAHLVDYHTRATDGLPLPDLDPDVVRPPTEEERRRFRAARRGGDARADGLRQMRQMARREDRRMINDLRGWWLQRMVDTPRPLEEKLTLLWHSHFASRHRDVRDAYLMYQQNALFRENASGSFAGLAVGVVRDPAMLRFLNNDRNIRRRPNENLAREMMELFTLGEGNYTEQDIKEGARALTGYHVSDNDFMMRRRAHDPGPKKILNRRGQHDGDDFVRILLRQDACARFVAFKLYKHFVADLDADVPGAVSGPRRIVIERLAKMLAQQEYRLTPALEVLLRSQHFYDPAVLNQKVKSPVELVVGAILALGSPDRDLKARDMGHAMRMMGQSLFDPPSVAGWDGGRAWLNTSTFFVRQNVCTYLITGIHPRQKRQRRDSAFDPMRLVASVPERTPQVVVDFLVDEWLGEQIRPDRRAPLVRFAQQRGQTVTADTVTALLLLISSMPEYQLC